MPQQKRGQTVATCPVPFRGRWTRASVNTTAGKDVRGGLLWGDGLVGSDTVRNIMKLCASKWYVLLIYSSLELPRRRLAMMEGPL